MKYSPRFWNHPAYRSHTNCLAYALNTVQYGRIGFDGALSNNYKNFAFLVDTDLGSGKITDPVLRAIVWIILDTMLPVRKNEYSLQDNHVIIYEALPEKQGHWYRYDGDGTISHKPGEDYADNTDDRGGRIKDLETALIKGHTPRAEDLIYCIVPKTGMVLETRDLETHEIFGELARDMRIALENVSMDPRTINRERCLEVDTRRRELFRRLVPINH